MIHYQSDEYKNKYSIFESHYQEESGKKSKIEQYVQTIKQKGYSEDRMRLIDKVVIRLRLFSFMNRYRRLMISQIFSHYKNNLAKIDLGKMKKRINTYIKIKKRIISEAI